MMAEPAQQLYDTWGNRASVKQPDCIANGERVFKVGGYSLTVPDGHDEPAKVAHIYNRWGRDENPMPNLSFSDGEMRIPVEDFADLILRRVPADELAEGLWHNDEVRNAFVECMIERYRGPVEDDDRRKVLHGLQVEIYAKAIDRAITRIDHAEAELRGHSNRSRWEALQLGHYKGLFERYRVTLHEMREAGLITDEQLHQRLRMHSTPEEVEKYSHDLTDPVVKESAGKQWQESRDYWRTRLEAFFPEPETPGPTPPTKEHTQ
jgi:hypothetical protein